MSIVTIQNLTFAHEGSYENVFENVSFSFDTDWKIGLVGRNGRGKTTLLSLLLGEEEYKGEIKSSTIFSKFPFVVTDETANTLDVMDHIDPNYEFWELCRELNMLKVPEDVLFRPFNTMSHGERTKVLMAMMFLKRDNYLLLDEPTNHLDEEGKKIIAEYLAKKKSFLLVSHDRALLDFVTDHTISINKSNIEVVSGSYSQWQENKDKQNMYELSENEKLKKDINKLKIAAKQTANWSNKVESTKTGNGPVDRGFIGHKSAKMMKRSKVIEARKENAISKKSDLLNDIDDIGKLKLSPLKHHSNCLITVSNLCVKYDEKVVIEDLDFDILQGQRVRLRGGNGSGKSSILKLIAGEKIPHTGIVKIGNGVKISYISQDTSHLKGDMRNYARESNVDYTLFLTILKNLGLERYHFEHDISELSEGQKKKILIARSLSESAHLYVWDEPLNYIDIQSRMQIEELILKYEPTMVFVEHDAIFSEKISNCEPINI